MAQIFISYARKDKDEVYPIVDELKRNGFECWIDKEGIESGSVFKKVIISAINECSVFVYMFSKNAFDSEWVNKEYDQAKAIGKHIIPIMLKGTSKNEDIMFDFRRVDYIDTDIDGWKEKLLRNLKSHFGRSASETEDFSFKPTKVESAEDPNEVLVRGYVEIGKLSVGDILSSNGIEGEIKIVKKINARPPKKKLFNPLHPFKSRNVALADLAFASKEDGEVELIINNPAFANINLDDSIQRVVMGTNYDRYKAYFKLVEANKK